MNIYLLGAANPETARQVDNTRRVNPHFNVVGFLDNDPAKKGTTFCGLPVLGGVDVLPGLLYDDAYVLNLITGSTLVRFETSREMAKLGARFTNLIDPEIDLRMTTIGVGNYVQDHVVIQASAKIGNNCSVHTAAVIAHEVELGHSVFVAHEASVSGGVRIGDGTFVGTNATILPRVSIGKWCVIGAGTVVNRDVPDYSVVVGNPGRIIKQVDQKYDHGDIFAES